MIAGTTINVNLAPILATELDETENLTPAVLELSNGYFTPAGNWAKRPGFSPAFTTPATESISAIVDYGPGFVVVQDGRIYRMDQTTFGLNEADSAEVQRIIKASLLTGYAAELAEALAAVENIAKRVDAIAGLANAALVPTIDVSIRGSGIVSALVDIEGILRGLGARDVIDFGPADRADVILKDMTNVQAALTVAAVNEVTLPVHTWVLLVGIKRKLVALIEDLHDLIGKVSTIATVIDFVAKHRQDLLEPVLGSRLGGVRQPTSTHLDRLTILAAGEAPVAIGSDFIARHLKGAPRARFVETMDGFVIYAGFEDSPQEFRWSAALNPDDNPAENTNRVIRDGRAITFVKRLQRIVFFFKENTIEAWVNVGGETFLARREVISRGCPAEAGHSVVEAMEGLYFLGDDYHFYELRDGQTKRISSSIRASMRQKNSQSIAGVHGMYFPDEHCVRWVFPVTGECFVYELESGSFSKDFLWSGSGALGLPLNCAMTRDNRTYVGDNNATGKVFEWSFLHENDGELPIKNMKSAQFRLTDDGTSARVKRVRFRCKRGEGLGAEAANMLVRWRFDMGDWTGYREMSLGAVGKRNPFVDLYNVGVGTDMTVEVVESDPVKFLIDRAFVTVDKLGR